MSKRWLAAFLTIVLVLLAAIAMLTYKPGLEVNREIAAPQGFGATAAYGKNSIVFSNGRSFVAYNYASGSSKLLSPDNAGDILEPQLAGIDSVSATTDQKYILFHEQQLPEAGILDQTLSSDSYPDLSLGFWFVYDIGTQAYQLLPTNTLLAKTGGNYIYTLASSNGSEAIAKYSPSGLNQLSSINISNVSNFYPASDGFMLQSPDNTVSFTKDGVVVQTVFKSAVLNGVSSDGLTALATVNTHQLVLFDIQKLSQKVIGNNVVNQPVWSAAGEALYFTGSSDKPDSSWQLNSYDSKTGKHETWRANKLSSGNFNDLDLTSLIGPGAAIMSKSNTDYYLVGEGLASPKLPDGSYDRTITPNGSDSIFLSYSSSQSTLFISWINYDPAAAQSAGFQQLRSDGYDPNLLNVQIGTGGD